jgi:hypothetical protein
MSRSDPRRSLRTDTLLLVATVLLVPAWLWLIPWAETDYSGWAGLARLYPAGDRPLVGSVGPTSVRFDDPGKLGYEFSYSNFAGGTRDVVYIEAGFDDAGFWLRSLSTHPRPAIFVPWEAVQTCELYRYRLMDTTIQVLMFDEPMLQHCTARQTRR